MAIKKHSVKNTYGRLAPYYSATAAGILPVFKANYFGTGADGDVTISVDTNLAATEDGDIIVKNYKNLTVDASKTLTTDKRCRGLLLFVDGDLTVNGTISMTARGCKANPATSGTDGDTPVAPGDGHGVGANGIRFPFLTAAGSDTLAAAEFAGGGTALYNLIAEFPQLAGDGTIIAIARAGGAGGAAQTTTNTAGVNGTAGSTNQSGGGGSGGLESATGPSGAGAAGTCFSGGAGGGATYSANAGNDGAAYGGKGGDYGYVAEGAGSGNPHGEGSSDASDGLDGTGGLLIIICSGNITGTGSIVSNGMNGGPGEAGGYAGGGATGGGVIVVARVGTDASVSKTANGGTGGVGTGPNYHGGDGGAGCIISQAVLA